MINKYSYGTKEYWAQEVYSRKNKYEDLEATISLALSNPDFCAPNPFKLIDLWGDLMDYLLREYCYAEKELEAITNKEVANV